MSPGQAPAGQGSKGLSAGSGITYTTDFRERGEARRRRRGSMRPVVADSEEEGWSELLLETCKTWKTGHFRQSGSPTGSFKCKIEIFGDKDQSDLLA